MTTRYRTCPMDMRAFILFLLILWVFEIAEKCNLTPTDYNGILVIIYEIWTDWGRKKEFSIFSSFNEIDLCRKIQGFCQTCPGMDLAILTGITLIKESQIEHLHCVKSVRIRSFSGPYFPAFGLNSPYLSVFIPNTQKYGPEKLRTRTPLTQCFGLWLILTMLRSPRIYKRFITTSLHASVLLFKKIVYIASLTNIRDFWILQCSCWVWSGFCKELLISGKRQFSLKNCFSTTTFVLTTDASNED